MYELSVDTLLGRKTPKWIRTSFYNEETDTIFIPATEKDFICAFFDNAPCIHNKGHFYLPIEWLEKEYPGNHDYKAIKKAIRKHIKTHS